MVPKTGEKTTHLDSMPPSIGQGCYVVGCRDARSIAFGVWAIVDATLGTPDGFGCLYCCP